MIYAVKTAEWEVVGRWPSWKALITHLIETDGGYVTYTYNNSRAVVGASGERIYGTRSFMRKIGMTYDHRRRVWKPVRGT